MEEENRSGREDAEETEIRFTDVIFPPISRY
jgi:hypothetical protein